MPIVHITDISFSCEEIITPKRNGRRKTSPAMLQAALKAYDEGKTLLDMKFSAEFFNVTDFDENHIIIRADGGKEERLFVGPRIGYLYPAHETAIALCTVGKGIVEAMNKYEKDDPLLFYYMDAFGVRALKEVSETMRRFVADYAAQKGFGVGPSMQPGSVAGWSVRGQDDLYRLAHGDKLSLSLNAASFLVPHLSNSALIGIGPDYTATSVGSMCHECPRHDVCLWRRDMEQKEN